MENFWRRRPQISFVKVFDLSTGQHVRSYEGHTHHVMDVSWKGDGTALVSAGADNAIKVWNAETGETDPDNYQLTRNR